MAIALRNTNSATITAAGTLSVPVPTGTVSGDVLIITLWVQGTTVPGTPTGLTLIKSANAAPTYAAYSRVCDGTEPASYSFTISGTGASGISRSYSGVDNTTPVNTSGTPNRTSNSATCTASAITTTVANCMLIWSCAVGHSEASCTTTGGWTNQVIASSSVGSAISQQLSQAAAGSSGSVAQTLASSTTNYGELIALAPATGPVNNTLTASPGAMTITGAATTLPVAHKPTMSPAAIAITGASSTLPVARKLVVSPGAMAITGSSATLPVKRLVSLSPGSITITGAAAKLPVGHQTSTSPGVVVISGSPATLVASGATHYTLTASAGSVAITGAAVTAPVSRVLKVNPGTFTVTGAAATTPVKWRIVTAPGAVTITGFATGAKQPTATAGDDDMWYFWANSLRQARVQAQPNVAKEPLAWWSVSIDVGEDDQLLELLALGLL